MPTQPLWTPYTQYTSTIGSSDHYEDTCDSGSTFTIHTLYPRGPPFLPPGKILKSTHLSPPSIYTDDVMSKSCGEEEGFTLNDFQLVAETSHRAVPSELQGAVISRENYLKLTSWFAVNVPKQESLNYHQHCRYVSRLHVASPHSFSLLTYVFFYYIILQGLGTRLWNMYMYHSLYM